MNEKLNDVIFIGVAGKAGCGKDEFAKRVIQRLDLTDGFEIKKVAFADALKQTVSKMYGIPVSDFNFRDTKEKPHDLLGGESPRHVLQQFGTEVVRAMDNDHWVKRLQTEVLKDWGFMSSLNIKVVIVPDVRFENERDFIQNSGGHLVYVERSEENLDVGDINITHASETDAYEDIPYDWYIDNTKSLNHLELQTRGFLSQVGLI